MLRGAPPPEGPEASTGWMSAAVKLPQRSLRQLNPRERAQLLALLGAWKVRSIEQFGQLGTQFRRSELKGLMHWVR